MSKPAMNTGIAGRLVVVVSAIVIFLSINLIASLKLEGAQVDLTEQKLFTLADGAKAILADVREPIKVTLYRSRDLINAVPDLQPHATQVAGLLRSFEQQSGGKISVDVVDVQPFSPEEDQALAYKLAGFNLNRAGDKGYFGLVGTNTVDTLETIAFLDPSRQAFLQYDLARFVHRLANPKEPKVAVVDGMSMLGVRDAGRMPWAVVEMLSQDYAVTPLPPNMTSVPPDTDVLIVAHPATLTPQAEYAIDQFVLGGGPALVFVDPFAERSAPSQQNAMIPMYPSSDIAPLMTAWGVAMDPTKVVGDSDMALQTVGTAGRQQVVANYLPWLKIDGDAFNQDDPVTARLNVMRMSSAGALHPVDGATTTMVPLIQTTPNSMLLDQALVMQRPNPNYLLGQFVPSGVRQVLAAEVTGPAHTAFPDGKPADPEGDDKGSETAPQLTSGNVNLIVVADADMLADDHVVNRNGQPVSSNGDFVLNAVEKLAGGDALIALRGGGQVSRPFTRLQAMQASADETYRAKEQDLTKELADIQQRLLELQAPVQSGGEDLQAMYERQQAEITTANTRMMEVRRELRDIRAALRSDVDRMDTWLKVLNIGLVPILLILAALGVALWQRARRSSANAQPVGE
ncbi:Gldg family protein [Paradevosia shaoguanensis]|uniref:Gldg family protein n=1 Tax=Paradevosia shaoguanensis TaxID=1335043 RepID=A0AA41UAR7_9HYPH|nr:Gldg family protein [Paradevosia shaoguanensis]MCF1742190.1 Gldg family protein [Paradevosia shaoguanensis]MCI0126673.1 Gldg family protein [Paradevosia shaoguanensis]